MTYTEEMTTSEILLRLASMRNELLLAVNDIEKISNNICYKVEQTESDSEKPNNCESKCCKCRWWSLEFGCQSKYKCEFEPLDKDTNVRSKDEPQMWTCPKCGETHHIDFERCPCCGYEPKTEPQTEEPTWEQVKEYCNKRCLDIVDSIMRKQWYKTESQMERPCDNCQEFDCYGCDYKQMEKEGE